jgi:SAM-dependent methyltransferase
MSSGEDVFGKGEYRRMIGWSERLERERPFLERFLARAVAPRLLDLGCGSGEHAAWLAEQQVAVVGVDRSAAQIESARELCTPQRPQLSFLQADFADLRQRLDGDFGGALCLGNVLPFLDAAELQTALRQWALLLAPKAPLFIQMLNYAGLRSRGVRHLAVLSNADETRGGEQVLLRWLRFTSESELLFFPTTLHMPPDAAEPTVLRARGVRMHAWNATTLPAAMQRAGFADFELYGSVGMTPYDARESPDLIICARRG